MGCANFQVYILNIDYASWDEGIIVYIWRSISEREKDEVMSLNLYSIYRAYMNTMRCPSPLMDRPRAVDPSYMHLANRSTRCITPLHDAQSSVIVYRILRSLHKWCKPLTRTLSAVIPTHYTDLHHISRSPHMLPAKTCESTRQYTNIDCRRHIWTSSSTPR